MEWLSIHIYVKDNAESLVIHTIPAIIAQLRQKNTFRKYFFIRYADPDFHIRLRILLTDVGTKSDVISYIDAMLEKDPAVKKSDEDQSFYFRLVEYQPELSRYGGHKSMHLAEDQFYLSSECVSMMFENNPDVYRNVLGTAMGFHLSFVMALGFSKKESLAFFDNILNGWAHSAGDYIKMRAGRLEKGAVKQYFVQAFDKQKQVLLPYLASFIEDISGNGRLGKQNVWKKWMAGNRGIYNDLRAVHSVNGGYLDAPAPFQFILQSYMHMNCNRLGVYNYDEAFLAFIMTQALQILPLPAQT